MSEVSTPGRSASGAGAPFWIAAFGAFVVVFLALLLMPRGEAVGETTAGDGMTVDLDDGVTATIVPGIRALGWRAENERRPHEIRLHVTVDNASDELFPRWVRVSLYEPDQLAEGDDLPSRLTDTLQTAHLDPGDQASTDFHFESDRACGEFGARISYRTTLDEEGDPSTVEVPFVVGDERCLARLPSIG